MNTPAKGPSQAPFSLELCEANSTDLPALSHIFSDSFHPVSIFMNKAIPDTLQISKWWNQVNTFALNDPEVRIIKIVDTAADRKSVALARWRLPARRRGMAVDAGCWSAVPLIADHDETLCNAFINFMAEQRRTVMQDRPHYCEFCVHSHINCRDKFNGERELPTLILPQRVVFLIMGLMIL